MTTTWYNGRWMKFDTHGKNPPPFRESGTFTNCLNQTKVVQRYLGKTIDLMPSDGVKLMNGNKRHP